MRAPSRAMRRAKYIRFIERYLVNGINSPIISCVVILAILASTHFPTLVGYLPQITALPTFTTTMKPYPTGIPREDLIKDVISHCVTVLFISRFTQTSTSVIMEVAMCTWGNVASWFLMMFPRPYVSWDMRISVLIQLMIIYILCAHEARKNRVGMVHVWRSLNDNLLKIVLSFNFLIVGEVSYSDDLAGLALSFCQMSIKLYCLWIMILFELRCCRDDEESELESELELELEREVDDLEMQTKEGELVAPDVDRKGPRFGFGMANWVLLLTCILIATLDVREIVATTTTLVE
ncbi:uncharacterized protein LODBEIA_P59830 [Lodderomyces beijingensis]|uniref:Uncharacterized protein n=1 Tax=Lodderomyces beijingensis TaxID=1775926 RepID=A0ABP0ZUE6_9ASCO